MKTKAVVLGGLVAVAVFCACSCFAMPVVVVCVCNFNDHQPHDPNWNIPMLLLSTSLLFSLRVGRLVARDWYYKGRNSTY